MTAVAADDAAAPRRVVSLNMCTDELVLLLAAPEQVVSVTHLARSPHEFAFWRTARRYPANDSSVASVAGLRPDLIVTMGGLARDRERLARRLGADLLVLPFPASLDDIERSVTTLADRLGRRERGRHFVAALHRLRSAKPDAAIPALFLSGGGETHYPGSLGAQWLELAGVTAPDDLGGRVPAERVLVAPPSVVIRSDYRRAQTSRGHFWPGYRFIENAHRTRTIWTDGRRWTCGGPALMPEIVRIREALAL
ncbi:ABC transporter substrate-binding protein [Parasphingopyxis marina]|uniref:ABC transporter substrate-binding protein n=1 Tax=Parasphingopyxis marina TaxID=2761622 RepID=A0A842HZJ4_9SPHN|nr:ABC transporter substrate-binding protein [Parasphingopyxis marina]MBC2777843.1 ABC transporter substrate-binding protein [Parasphingopyxis marina]